MFRIGYNDDKSQSNNNKIIRKAQKTRRDRAESRLVRIHSQQLNRKCEGKNSIKVILNELLALQKSLGIRSKYVFCHEDGEWIKTDAYETCLRRLMTGLGYDITNNHSFRMSLNSNVFIGKYGLPVTERARLLGHSVETNLRYYSFAGKDSLDDICAILNGETEVSPESHQNIIAFAKKKPKNRIFSGF